VSDHVECFEHAGQLVLIEYDQDAESSRKWDNLGHMICWHSRYNLGDVDDKHPRPETHDGTHCESPTEFYEWWKENGKGGILLSLYLYDHSGITISCSPFSCPWDSGQVGYIYITAEKMREEYSVKRISAKLRERVAGYLKGEVETYDEYLTGQVYGYVVAELEPQDEDESLELEDREGDQLDSCWGFYGLEHCIAEAKSMAEWHQKKQKEKADAEAEELRVQEAVGLGHS
jgi:hypothetical protein